MSSDLKDNIVWLILHVFTAGLVLFCVLLQGFYQEIAGPLMFDLRMHLRTTSENIARSVSAQGIGIFLGALISGCSVDACGQWKFLLITIGALLASVTVVSMAFVNNLTVLWLTFFLMGTSAGLTNVGKCFFYLFYIENNKFIAAYRRL